MAKIQILMRKVAAICQKFRSDLLGLWANNGKMVRLAAVTRSVQTMVLLLLGSPFGCRLANPRWPRLYNSG
jgi:hypothetical protein